MVQQKTKHPVQFDLLDHAQGSLRVWLERREGAVTDYVFPSRIDAKHISTRQYARLVEEWVNGVGLRREDYGTHSLRRTKAAMICKQTGKDFLVAISRDAEEISVREVRADGYMPFK